MKLVADENKCFHVLVRGIIMDKEHILVAKAKNSDNTFLPGGHLEFNENLRKSLAREMMEEMGIDCMIGEYVGCIENQWTENNIVNQEINHIFIVDGVNRRIEVKSKESHLEFYWIKIADMKTENLLPESMRTIIGGIYKNNKINYISEII
jgi:ADP-ribose pyrophosphatase YjhB (NUDIX family)